MPLDEFALIRRFFSPPATRADVRLGVGDDAAVLAPAPGHEIVVTTDTLLAGVHFPEDLAADAVGHRALAVNLSDIAAMGAVPCWATLALSLPSVEEPWLTAFARGFFALADDFEVALVGGDTVRGPLGITVQLIGQVPAGAALTRSGARPGDVVMISGPLGLAAAALQLRAAGRPVPEAAAARFDRPGPRIAQGLALRRRASACIDVSDGLASDLGHILTASHCGATLDVGKLAAVAPAAAFPGEEALQLALDGGDDYELCFTCAPETAAGLSGDPALGGCRPLGVIENRAGLRLRHSDGRCEDYRGHGYSHF